MATTKKTTALAVIDSFQIVNRYEGIDPELMAELQDELSDLDPESGITCRQIKVPSGGGLAFEVQGEDENDAEPMKQIDTVIVFTHRVSAYWPGTYGSGDDAAKIPACSSMDGKTGFNPQHRGNHSVRKLPLQSVWEWRGRKRQSQKGKGLQEYAPDLHDDGR